MSASSTFPPHDQAPVVVAIPDLEVSDAMQLADQLRGDTRFELRIGGQFSANEDQVCEVAGEAQIIAVGLAPVTRHVLERCPDLRLIIKCGIGVELIDLSAAQEHSVVVARTAGANFVGVAEYVIAAALDHARHLPLLSEAAHRGEWGSARARWAGRLPALSGQTIGLVGFGAIARHVAKLAHAFGMRVLAYDPYVDEGVMTQGHAIRADLDELMRSSDVVSVHATLTADNGHLLDVERLGLLKPTALLVNAARGGLVDQRALATMLTEGRLAGAVLDVVETEPPDLEDPIMLAPNCLITPHLAGCTRDGYLEIGAVAASLIRTYSAGRPLPEHNLVGV